ncbi:HNH endonuclease signature motif containing protein [Tepidiforma sp.]|uniref:HNH endonuclease n=1 Tax=Tepidiforma sp. TaxID=2682230 RepID=UPI002ADE85F3|nr:HNH endonuclease signature motif containing protein [Tepidiforma sp.]
MLQRGMQFRAPPAHGIILMSLRPGAPYADSANADGTIWYEGHDVPRSVEHPNPKVVDQPRTNRAGRLTENGKFAESVEKYREGLAPPARFHVYEKVRDGIWVFRGAYLLTDYRFEWSTREGRNVFRFFLEPAFETDKASWMPERSGDVEFERRIPGWVQALVYKRDRGRCVKCGETKNLHFDHILPFSKGGSSSDPENIQLLCAHHNLEKGAGFGG